jgi:hypothetical protein
LCLHGSKSFKTNSQGTKQIILHEYEERLRIRLAVEENIYKHAPETTLLDLQVCSFCMTKFCPASTLQAEGVKPV